MTSTEVGGLAIPSAADVAIVTILPEAYAAVERVFELTNYATREGYQWAWGRIEVREEGSAVVVAGRPLDRENVAAATFVDALLAAWKPRDLLVVDIGGAVKGREKVRLGDVVTHTFLHYYDYHKVGEDGVDSPRYLPLPGASTRLRELSRRPAQRGDESWLNNIRQRRPTRGTSKVLPGEMLVGGAIQSHSPRLLRLLRQHPKAIAVEMEGVGAARAVLDWGTRGPVPEYLIIRGMSDYCNVPQTRNQATRDRWRRYAAAAAAAHAHALVREMDSDRLGREGRQRWRERIATGSVAVDNLWEVVRTELRGREEEMDFLRKLFSAQIGKRELRHPHVICGEPGVGKSALARAVAEDVRSHYAACWWIDAADELKIRLGLREFARRLGIPTAQTDHGPETSDEAHTHRFLSDLRDFLDLDMLGGRALVVLDNVDEAELKHSLSRTVLRYLPATICDVLITSQSSRWQPVAPSSTLLKGLDSTTAAALIAHASGRPQLQHDHDIDAICKMFGGRPLFLKQIASLLRDGDNPAQFRRRLSESPEDALEVLPEVESFEPLWRQTFGMAIDRAEAARPGARKVLETFSFFSGESVPLALLYATAGGGSGETSAHMDAVLGTLRDRSLLECQREVLGRSYVLHRIIGAIIRMLVRLDGHLPEALSNAARAISFAVPSRDFTHSSEGRELMAAIAPHIDAVGNHVRKEVRQGLYTETVEETAEALSMLGLYHRTVSEWKAAEDASRKAVELSDADRSPGSTALRKVRLANIMRQSGSFEPARELLEEALPPLKKHGANRDYAWALTVHARVLRHQPRSAPREALPILYQALDLLKPFEGEGDTSLRRQLSALHGYVSVVCRQLSDLDAAESAASEGLRILTGGMLSDEVLKAPDLPREVLLATHLRALGGVWRLRGDFGRAMDAHRRALRIFEDLYGPDHTDVCRALDSLGRGQREWGDLEGAIQSFSRAARISNLHFGPEHAHCGTANINLALVYLDLGELDIALDHVESGLRTYRQAYGEAPRGGALKSEATIWALFVRANIICQLGELKKAEEDHKTILDCRSTRYPSSHALTASSHYALGEVLCKRGDDWSRSLGLSHHRRALTIRREVFGEGPNYWVAQSEARLGILKKDSNLLASALHTFRSQLKPGHWRTSEVAVALESLNS